MINNNREITKIPSRTKEINQWIKDSVIDEDYHEKDLGLTKLISNDESVGNGETIYDLEKGYQGVVNKQIS